MAIIFISAAVLGCDPTSNGAEGATNPSSQAGRRSHLRASSPPTQPWTGDGIVPSKVPWEWSAGDQAGESTTGSFGKNSCQVESRALPIGHPMAKVPKEGRGRVQAPEAEVLVKTKTAARRLDTSRRRVQRSTASTSRGGSSNGYTKWRRACTTQANRRGRSRTAVGRDRDSTKTEAGSCPCGRRSGPEEVEVPDQDPGFSQLHEQDGFLIGRHGSCYNVHAKRPRFFCLVEAAIIDDDSAPVEVGNTPTTWWDLASTLPAQTIPPPSTPPYCKHECGPRQAEYVAQLMRYEVETNQFPEAFDDCLWDETLISLQHLDRIEQTEMFEAAFSGHQPKDVVRQIEGSTLWTLLALEEDLHQPRGIEWYGATPQQGPFAHLVDDVMAELYESLGTDCNSAADIIRGASSNGNDRIDFVSYGYFERYRGQRVVTIQVSQLATWRHRVQEAWADFEDQSTIRLHIADPMPLDEALSIHVIARSHAAAEDHHFLLMDKIEESPQAESRFVIEVSQQPNGFELLLTSGININTVTARTILKHGPEIWQHHRRLPVSDGQYWRVLVEDEMDEVHMMQMASSISHTCPKPTSYPLDHPLEASSHHPHVIDRWRDGGRELSVPDHSSFMQQPLSVATSDDVEDYHLFYRESGHTNLHIADSAAHDFSTMVENHLNLPTEGPSSIRTFHMALYPPQLEISNYNVHLIEFRGDADSRLMNDDVLCLYQLTFMHPDRRADTKDKFKVLWTPHAATRDRILFHLRAADPCRTRVCTLYVNNEVWSELDTTIRHFKDGDFIALYVTATRESSVIATRCDFQGYEVAERERRIFINSTSSEDDGEENPTPTTERSRSRASRRSHDEPEGEPEHRPHDDDDDDDPSLMQLTSPASQLDSPIDFEIQSTPIFQEVCLLSPEDPCQQWTIISYGLHRTHLGLRSAKIHEMEETTPRTALKEVWEDVPLRATLHFILPNPDVGPCVHVIVEFIDDTNQPPVGIPVLRRIFHDDQLIIEAAYHADAARASDLYYQADLQDICDHSECQIWLNHVWLREMLPFRLRHGALLDFRIDSRPQRHANMDAGGDSHSLLQTQATLRSRRQPIYLASHLPTTLVVSCDFRKVSEANQILTSLPCMASGGPTGCRNARYSTTSLGSFTFTMER